MKKIAIYVRKSVEVKDSVSIETQTEMCKNYFADEKCEFEVFSDDGYSGATIERPAFQLLNKKLKLNIFDTIVCYKLDRISRKVIDIADFFELLENKTIDFVCVKDKYDTTTPMGRAMLYFASVFAQLERETIAERVKDAMLNLAKKGCFTGGKVAKGYKVTKIDGKSYLELEDENFIKDLFYSYLKEPSLYSLYGTVRKYFKSDNNNPNMLRRMLQSPIYVQSCERVNEYLNQHGWETVGEPNGCGYLTYNVSNKETNIAIVSKHNAIVDATTWLNIQHRLDEVAEKNLKRCSNIFWLSSFLKCPHCGGYYIIANSKKNTYYVCSNRLQRTQKTANKCKNNKYINSIIIEKEIDNFLVSLKNKQKFLKQYNENHVSNNSNSIKKLKKSISKNEIMINNLIDKLAILSNEAGKNVSKRLEDITKENTNLKLQLENEELECLENNSFGQDYVFENIQTIINETDLNKKRVLIKNIFKEITYNPFNGELKITFL
ncbi:MAG: putative resolvase [Clostridiaceae bacterium]|jgi:DNA invertase Pin-like site-specific DNA recombinase/ssDNA-binding Zn-finger/Zn-ribbon topoisomerase 1|nr:putative resolvase [Clostridiaceae bacterium]